LTGKDGEGEDKGGVGTAEQKGRGERGDRKGVWPHELTHFIATVQLLLWCSDRLRRPDIDACRRSRALSSFRQVDRRL